MRFEQRHAVAMWILVVWLAALPAAAQPVAVTSAEPATGEQDTLSLDVRVKGKNFAPGAQSEFLLDDDTNGGITVIRTTFVSSTEVVANIRIATGATLTLFDIRVRNLNGRTGRGSDLFRVVEKGAHAACTTEPLDPSKFELVNTLNFLTGSGAAAYGPNLGISASLAPATLTLPDLTVRTVLVAVVGTPRTTGRLEFFLLDPVTGNVIDGPLCESCAPQAHVSVAIPTFPGEQAGSRHISKGDVNADGIPDVAVSDMGTGSAAVFVGGLSNDGRLEYRSILLPRPAVANYGYSIAVGDLDGVAGDEIAVGKPVGGSGKNLSPAAVYFYRVDGLTATLYQTFVPADTPALKNDDWYASDIAIGDVTHDGRPDLVVGVPYREVGGVTDAGAIFVHAGAGATAPYTLTASPLQLSAAVRVSKDLFGFRVAAANADSSGLADVVGLSSTNTSTPHGDVLHGPITSGNQSNPVFTFTPRPGVDTQWSHRAPQVGDLNGDGLQDLAMGLPGADTSTSGVCSRQGLAYVFLGQPGGGWTRLSIQGPYDDDGSTFGYGIATADGYPFIVIGNNQYNLGSESNPAGQAFVYRVKRQ